MEKKAIVNRRDEQMAKSMKFFNFSFFQYNFQYTAFIIEELKFFHFMRNVLSRECFRLSFYVGDDKKKLANNPGECRTRIENSSNDSGDENSEREGERERRENYLIIHRDVR